MKQILYGSKFKKDMKKVANYPNFSATDFQQAVTDLAEGRKLPDKYRDHKLVDHSIKYLDHKVAYRDFHIKPNICIIYAADASSVTFIRIGSHSDLGLTEAVI